MSTNAHPTQAKVGYLYSDPGNEHEAGAVALQFGERDKIHELTVHINRVDVERLAAMLNEWLDVDLASAPDDRRVQSQRNLNDQYAPVPA